ncbi:hypothetical protein J2T59_001955 [Methanosalsum natronophilum]|nr:hypothetical protein [Methanosalsum natronophilum]
MCMIIEKLTKIQMQIIGFFILSFLYVGVFNFYHYTKEAEFIGFVPGTFIIGVIGFFLAGVIFDRLIREKKDD